MASHSSVRSKSLVSHRALGVPVEENLLNLSTTANSQLYVTPTGGIGNVNKPEPSLHHRGSLYPLSPGKVLKLPWKKHRRVTTKASLHVAPTSPTLSHSDWPASPTLTDSCNGHNDYSTSSMFEHSPSIFEKAYSRNLKECNSPPLVHTGSLSPAPSIKDHQSMTTIVISQLKNHPLLSSSVNRAPRPMTSSTDSVPNPPTPAQSRPSVGQFEESAWSNPRDDESRGPRPQADFSSQPSSSNEGTTTSNIDKLWNVLPEHSLTQIPFAEHLANVKIAEAETMRNLISPTSSQHRTGPALKMKGSSYSRAKSIDVPDRARGLATLQRYPDPRDKAQFPALAPRFDGLPTPPCLPVKIPHPKSAKRSLSQDTGPRITRSLIHGRDEAAWHNPPSSCDGEECTDSPMAHIALSDLVLDRDGLLVAMKPDARAATPETKKNEHIDDNLAPIITQSPPSSPVKYLGLINSAAVNAGAKARGRRRTQVGAFTAGTVSLNRMNSNCSLESSCCSHDSLVCSGNPPKSYPSDSSITSSTHSPTSLLSVEDKDDEPSPPDDENSTEPRPIDQISNSLDLDDELEGVKLMIGSRAVCPKYPLQHLQYRQLQPKREVSLPTTLLMPSALPATQPNRHPATNNSSLGQILGYYQQESVTGIQSSTELNLRIEVGTAF